MLGHGTFVCVNRIGMKMSTLTITLWFLSISIVAAASYILGAIMTSGKRADEIEAKSRRRRVTKISHGRKIKPDLVLISPTEMRAVKS
jgi:hypothetical protein